MVQTHHWICNVFFPVRSFFDGEPFTDSEVIGCWTFAGCFGRFLHILLFMFLPHGCTDEFAIPVFFLFLSLFSWPLLFFIEYLQFFPTYFVFSSWCKLHCFNSWTFQVVNVFQEIFIIWLENRCLIVQSAYYSQPKGYLTA